MIVQKIRSHFPALLSSDKVYLDSAATACMPASVIDEMSRCMSTLQGGVHRGIYDVAEATTQAFEDARREVMHFIGAEDPSEIVFTSGATDSVNTIAHAWGLERIREGKNIVITQAEHHASYLVWHELANAVGAELRILPLDDKTYHIDQASIEEMIDENTAMVCFIHSSNVLGPIWGSGEYLLAQATRRAKEMGACVVYDCAQSVAHQSLSLKSRQCDFAFFSVHKMGGPTGLGILYARKDRHEELIPFRFGGGMVLRANAVPLYKKMPYLLEAGTPPMQQIFGLRALLSFYRKHVDFNILRVHESMLCADLIAGLEEIPEVVIFGNKKDISHEGHVVSFDVKDIHAHDVASFLSTQKICVRAGDHCAHPLSQVWGHAATVRASFFMYNTHHDVAALLAGVRACIKRFKDMKCTTKS